MTSITAPDGTVVAAPRTYARGSANVQDVSPESVRVIASDRTAWLDLDGVLGLWSDGAHGDVAGQLAALAAIGRAITAQAEARLAEEMA